MELTRSVGGTAGSVTAEAALVLPLLVLVALAAAWMLAVVGARLSCVEAARAGARAAARGDPDEVVRRQVAGAVRAPLDVAVRHDRDVVVVEIAARLPGPPGLGRLLPGGWRVHASAVAAVESGVPP